MMRGERRDLSPVGLAVSEGGAVVYPPIEGELDKVGASEPRVLLYPTAWRAAAFPVVACPLRALLPVFIAVAVEALAVPVVDEAAEAAGTDAAPFPLPRIPEYLSAYL